MPSNVKNGTYTSCDGDLQNVVGIYSVNGVTFTWTMPPTSEIPPYTPRVPASSNCQTFQATDLFVASSSTSGTNGSGSVAATSKELDVGAVVGGVVGGIAMIVAGLIVIAFLFLRSHKQLD